MKGSERAGLSLKPTVGATDGGNVRSRAVMRHGDEPLSTCRTPVNRLTDRDSCLDREWE